MQPFGILPHRQPFSMLDRVDLVEEGRLARGVKMITAGDSMVSADGGFPQCLVVEAMAQVSGIAAGRRGGSLFAAITGMVFSRGVRAGDVLEVEGLLERTIGPNCIFRCRATVGAEQVAEGGIILHFDEAA
ncbi:MAG: 3-hydroxyacyl-ACP dehydratase FabZ [Thermodesulfovibrionales bacterium]